MKDLYYKVEYDLNYNGGNYSNVGAFVLVPEALVKKVGMKAAFTQTTGQEAVHIIHYSESDRYDAEGKLDDGSVDQGETEGAAAPKMVFSLISYADISNGYLNEKDRELLLDPAAPQHIANLDGGWGALFYTPDKDVPEACEAFPARAREFGFSERFIEIMMELSRQDIRYVRFDADGDEIDGLELDPEIAAVQPSIL